MLKESYSPWTAKTFDILRNSTECCRTFFICELIILFYNSETTFQVVEYFMNTKFCETKKMRNEVDPKFCSIHVYHTLVLSSAAEVCCDGEFRLLVWLNGCKKEVIKN